MNKSANDHSDIFLPPVHTAHENVGSRHPTISNGYDMDENEVMMAAPLDLPHNNIPQSKYHREVLRYDNTTAFNTAKEDLVRNDSPLNLHATNSRYRSNRLPSLNTQKLSLDDSGVNTYDDIQDMSFPEELTSLSRTSSNETSFSQYYYKPTSPTMDICNPDLSGGFTNDNFPSSIPSVSSIFHHNDTNSYGLPDHSDEYLLNNLEISDTEKLVLTNEDYAMLTQGKQRSYLELILNNGEVLYAIIDPSDNDYNPSSPRITLISKDSCMNSERFCPLPDTVNDRVMDQFATEPNYNRNQMSSTSPLNCSSTTVNDFVVTSQHYQPTLASTTMPKPLDSSSPGTDNFSLFRDDFTVDNQPFQTIVDTYRGMVPQKHLFSQNETILSNTPIPTMNRIEGKKSLSPVLHADDSKTDKATSKIDYFPSAVNSIVVSETGKKYPKKYSFYSNNFSSFLNREPMTKNNVTNRSETSKMFSVSNDNVESYGVDDPMAVERMSESSTTVINVNTNEKLTCCPNIEAIVSNVPTEYNIQYDSQPAPLSNNDSVGSSNSQILKQLNMDEIARNKFLNSHPKSAVNNICDATVQSRARTSLPSAYLSINRIKGKANQKKPIYGVFARKTIPSKTQFGPVEGILIKIENEDETLKKDEISLRLTVESENGKFLKLDVSNDETSNWMKFVRPAKSYKEQNLIVSQHGSSLYFTTIEEVRPKQELLVWYSVWYSKKRNYKLLDDDLSGELCPENCNSDRRPPDDITLETKLEKYSDDVEIISYSAPANNENDTKESVASSNLRCGDTKGENDSSIKKLKFNGHKTTKSDKSAKSLWLCTYCDLTFSNASVMNFHILVHAADNVEKTQLTASNRLENNYDMVADNNKHICPQCNEEFAEKKELISHVAKHGLKIQRWSDNKVVEEYNTADDTQQNEMDEHLDEPTFECEFCKRNFKSSFALEIHKRFHSTASILECPMCEMTFEKLNEMREHVYTHAVNGIFTCPHCPKSYDRYKFMRKHIRACHGKITFACKLCKKICKSQHKLRSHMLRHSDEREFLCSICGKLFKRADKLTEHVKNTHSEEREKTKTFETIEKKTINVKKTKKKTKDKVLRIISGDCFYKCYVCNIGFKRRGMLVNHLNQFHPEISLSSVPELNAPILKAYCNFYCLYCDKVYKSNSKRKEHILKSHPGSKLPDSRERGTVINDPYAKHVGSVILDPFNCEYCHRQYVSRAKLLNHCRKNHSDLLLADQKLPRYCNSKNVTKNKKRNTTNIKSYLENELRTVAEVAKSSNDQDSNEIRITQHTICSTNSKPQECPSPTNDQMMNLNNVLNEELRVSSSNPDQYLKILQQSSNDINESHVDENSNALLQQILTSYQFSNS